MHDETTIRVDDSMAARGAHVEIFEEVGPDGREIGIIKPIRIKINGEEVLTSVDTPIRISDISKKNCLTIKLELFVRELVVHAVPAPDENVKRRYRLDDFFAEIQKMWDERD